MKARRQKRRSSKSSTRKAWSELSKRLRSEHPACEKCGSERNLQVHHILPRRLYPGLLLEERNLVVLCPRCHSFCAGSAHKDGTAFTIWLMENLPEKFSFIRQFLKET